MTRKTRSPGVQSAHGALGTEAQTAQSTLALSAVVDRPLVWRRGGSVRYVVATVQAAAKPTPAGADPRPLNVALVVDASGSMAGARLEAAKRAASVIVEALGPRDRISIVSFASDVQIHVDGSACDDAGRDAAVAALAALEPRGSTNLAAGWFQGAECVARVESIHSGSQCRVLMLSDGMANQGLVEPAELAVHASAMRDRGIFTSCVGIGDDYSTEQMQALADHGGGRMHDAERPGEIAEVVVAELRDMAHAAAEAVRVELRAPAGVRVVALGGFPTQSLNDGLACVIGSLPAGARRRAIFRLTCPAGKLGDALALQVSGAWRVPGSGAELQLDRLAPSVQFAPGRDNSAQSRDIASSIEVAQTWQADIVRAAIRMNRDGRVREAAAWLMQQLRHFERYARDLPGGAALIDELQRTARRVMRPMHERSRKEIDLAMYQRVRLQADARHEKRAEWGAFLD
ncbi:MAG: VWA domain-containing protein [Burkholderiaceae bacterium]|nr:VWA domain-containing protein [Burkholderiaceae bacterium]